MSHADDARIATNEALAVIDPRIIEAAHAVRDEAASAAIRGVHRLVDPIPASIPADVADRAYGVLAAKPFGFRVTCDRKPDGSCRWIVSW